MLFIYKLYLKTKIENLSPDSWLYRLKKKIAKLIRYIRFQTRYSRDSKFAQLRKLDTIALSQTTTNKPQILLLKLDHIGDFLTALDAFKILRNGFPEAHITLMCLPSVVSLALSTTLFDKVIGFSAAPESVEIGRTQHTAEDLVISNFHSLLDTSYWLAIDLRHDADTRKFLGYVNAEHRAGFLGDNNVALTIYLPNMEWEVQFQKFKQHSLPLHNNIRLKLLCWLVVDNLKAEVNLGNYLPSKIKASGQLVLTQLSDKTETIKLGLCIGAGAELKTWPLDYWITLLKLIAEKYPVTFVFFGGHCDQALSRELMQHFPPDKIVDLVGSLSLTETKSYLEKVGYYIGCDTGMTHFAAGLGISTLSLFSGVSSLPVWQAKGPHVRTLYVDVPCAPCHLRFQSDCINEHLCMKKMTPEAVFRNFVELQNIR
jgi:ADP-heptose:LPS heptosyltransferase